MTTDAESEADPPRAGWRGRLRRQPAAFLAAVTFLTQVPVPARVFPPGVEPTVLLRASVVYFPLVGGLVGAFTGGLVWAALLLWPPVVAVVLGLIAEALLTGGFHEDAVADCCDAFGGGWTRDDVLRIMKDSRVGSFGALGLTLALALRGGCLLALPAGEVVVAVAASAAIGRWGILLLMAAIPPVANRESLARDVGERIGWRALAAGTALAVPGVAACGWAAPLRTAAGVLAVAVVTLVWAGYVRRRLGGVTGDCLGCGCYLGQCAFLLAAVGGGR